MIVVDDRVGSAELLRLFPHGMAELGRLEFGDVAWWGNGPDGVPWRIGVERKTLNDFLNSMTTDRFSGHQLGGLRNTYNFSYIVVEGSYRPNPQTGVLETPKAKRWVPVTSGRQPHKYSAVINYLNTMTVICGIPWIRTFNDNETVHAVLALYHWWADKEWDEHESHLALYTPPPERAHLVPPPFVAKVAMQLKGVGWKQAHRIAAKFRTVREMLDAGEEEWCEVERVGKETARNLMEQLHGG